MLIPFSRWTLTGGLESGLIHSVSLLCEVNEIIGAFADQENLDKVRQGHRELPKAGLLSVELSSLIHFYIARP